MLARYYIFIALTINKKIVLNFFTYIHVKLKCEKMEGNKSKREKKVCAILRYPRLNQKKQHVYE